MANMNSAPWLWWIVLLLPALAALCLWRALRSGARIGAWARVLFWTGTIGGGAFFLLLCQGHCQIIGPEGQLQVLAQSYGRPLLMVSTALPILVLVLVGISERRSGRLTRVGFVWGFELLGGAVCFTTLMVSTYLVWSKSYAEPLRRKAGLQWAEIGHSMPEFEKSLAPVTENDSLRQLTSDLKPFGLSTFYREGGGKGEGRVTLSNSIDLPREVLNFLSATGTSDGDIIVSHGPTPATLEAHAKDLKHLYAGVLQRDPPVWSVNPSDGLELVTPDYRAVRVLSQWIVADAYHRLEGGDEKGAEEAVTAGLRMTQDLSAQPIIVSCMIRAAIEALFAPVIARLPEDPEAMQQLAGEVETKRRAFLRTVQLEAWAPMHCWEEVRLRLDSESLSKWLTHPLSPGVCQLWLVDCSKDWLALAEQVRTMEQIRNLAASDLGEREMEESLERYPSSLSPNLSRAWLRLNGIFLLREQAEMIRWARAQMQAGKTGNLGEHLSVVIPGSKWEATGDPAANAIRITLTPRPRWTSADVFSPYFFLLPLDGSKSWQLAGKS